jgi:hypothetical protein
MGTIVFALFALDSSLAGVLGGVLIFRLLARSVDKNPGRAEKPVTKVMIFRPNDRAKEAPEMLFNNAETAKTPVSFQPIEQNLLRGTETALGKNASVFIKQDITLNQIVPDEPESINNKILKTPVSFQPIEQNLLERTEAAAGKNASAFIKQDIALNQIVPGKPESINNKILKTPVSFQPIEQNLLKRTEAAAGKNASAFIKQDSALNQIVPGKSESINNKTISIRESHKKTRQTAFIRELEINLTIATAPWKDRPVPFQTTCWEAKLEKVEPSMVSHLQDLIQLYVDISLANNVVWLATEIGHRSKELDDSYMKLCSGIAERIKGIIPVVKETILPMETTS